MLRSTRQKEAIRRAFESDRRPLSGAEVFRAAAQEVPGLGIATVYRAISSFVEEGTIVAVPIPGEPARYETAEAAARHHHHFHCSECGRVFDIPGCPGGVDRLAPPGFEVSGHEILLRGRCAECHAM